MAVMADDAMTDPYLWLEDVTGDDALDWVRAHNAPTVDEFAGDDFEAMRTAALEVLDTDARIPYVRRRGEFLYNFWRDAANPRGLWRRTTLDSYRSGAPEWDVIIDVDELSRTDDTNWVWAGANVIEPELTRALVSLSPGGSDAAVVREFDMATREFVPPAADGFQLPEAKSRIGWEDEDTVLVGTDFGPGSLTDSGYPRVIKRWRRGQPLTDAVRRGADRRGGGRRARSNPGVRTDAGLAGRRLLQRRGLRTARRPRQARADPHRRTDRCERVGASAVDPDRAPHRLEHRHRVVHRGFAVGGRL